MFKLLKVLLTVLTVSFYFFPIDIVFLPTNTKNLLAAIGIVFVVFELIRQKEAFIPRQLLILLLISSMVSIMSLVSITINQTPDDTYVTYIRSAIIWLSGAFSVCYIIQLVHGRIDVPLVVHYLIGACLFQCVSAMLIQFVPDFQEFVDRYVQQGQDILKDLNRIYGIGASLDVAGSRFSVVLIAISYLLAPLHNGPSKGYSCYYTISFVIIAVIGNMIARTTTIGMIIGVIWILFSLGFNQSNGLRNGFMILVTVTSLVLISILLYQSFPDVKRLMEFGFEGFFSLVETGKWQVDSNDTLRDMIVWPEELRTWIIGDGYFLNSRYDPNYLGDAPKGGYYMGTDIGYLRFLFYFGVLGMVWIIGVIVYSAYVCAEQFKEYAWLFVMALGVGLVVWAKVSTDIFLFFCLFLCAAALREEDEEETDTPPDSEAAGIL